MNRERTNRIRQFVGLFVLTSFIGCDQATKYVATAALQNAPPQSFFGETVHLSFALNSGGFLSLGGNLPVPFRQYIFIGVNSLLMIALSAFLIRRRDVSLTMFLAVVLILAGGIGNLIDRIGNDGQVTDFIVLRMGPLCTGVFNVADVAVTFGVSVLFCLSFQGKAGELKSELELPNSSS